MEFLNKAAASAYINLKIQDRRPAEQISDADLREGLLGVITMLAPPSTAAEVDSAVNMAVWGDSMTSSKPIAPYPEQLSELGYFNVYNGGIAGETSTQIRARFDAHPEMHGWPTVFWVGRNDTWGTPATLLANIAAMVAALGHNRYLVVSICNSALADERIGTTKYNQIAALNATLLALYTTHFTNVRVPLVAAWNPALPQDVIDHGYDQIPQSVRPDNPIDYIHLNPAGYKIVAQTVLGQFPQLVTQSENSLSLKSLLALFDSPPNIGTKQQSNIHALKLSVGKPLFNPAAAPFLLQPYATPDVLYNKQALEVRGAAYFLHDAATGGQGGIAIKNFSPAGIGGVGAMEISGTNAAFWLAGKGIVFYNGSSGGITAPAIIIGSQVRINGQFYTVGDAVMTSSGGTPSVLNVLPASVSANRLNVNCNTGRVFEVYSTVEGIIIPRIIGALPILTAKEGELFYNTTTGRLMIGRRPGGVGEYQSAAHYSEIPALARAAISLTGAGSYDPNTGVINVTAGAEIARASTLVRGVIEPTDWRRLFGTQSAGNPTVGATLGVNVDLGGQMEINILTAGARAIAFSNVVSGDQIMVHFNNTSASPIVWQLPHTSLVPVGATEYTHSAGSAFLTIPVGHSDVRIRAMASEGTLKWSLLTAYALEDAV